MCLHSLCFIWFLSHCALISLKCFQVQLLQWTCLRPSRARCQTCRNKQFAPSQAASEKKIKSFYSFASTLRWRCSLRNAPRKEVKFVASPRSSQQRRMYPSHGEEASRVYAMSKRFLPGLIVNKGKTESSRIFSLQMVSELSFCRSAFGATFPRLWISHVNQPTVPKGSRNV